MVEARWPRKKAREMDVRESARVVPHWSCFKVVQACQLYYLGGCDFAHKFSVKLPISFSIFVDCQTEDSLLLCLRIVFILLLRTGMFSHKQGA